MFPSGKEYVGPQRMIKEYDVLESGATSNRESCEAAHELELLSAQLKLKDKSCSNARTASVGAKPIANTGGK